MQKPCLPTIESLVSALAGSNDFMANQTSFRQEMPSCSTPFSSPEEMAAYSAGLPTCLSLRIWCTMHEHCTQQPLASEWLTSHLCVLSVSWCGRRDVSPVERPLEGTLTILS